MQNTLVPRRCIHSDSSSSEHSSTRFSVNSSSSKSLIDSQTSWFDNKFSESHQAHRNTPCVSWFQKLHVLHHWIVSYYILLDCLLVKFFSRRKEITREKDERQSRIKYLLLLLVPLLILAAWSWLAPHTIPRADTVVPLVETTSSDMDKFWYLPFSINNIQVYSRNLDKSVFRIFHAVIFAYGEATLDIGMEEFLRTMNKGSEILDGKETSPGDESAVNLKPVVQMILGNGDLENLLLAEVKRREQEAKEAEQTLQLQIASLQKELDNKCEMISRLLELNARLAEDVEYVKQLVEKFEIELQSVRDVGKNPTIVDSSQGFWRREIRRLKDRMRLVEVSHSKRPRYEVTPPPLPTVALEEHVRKFLTGSFNSDVEIESKIPGIRTWLGKLFVAKEDLESKLANISSTLILEVGEASRQSAQAIMHMVSDQIRREYAKQRAELAAKLSEQKRNSVLPVATLSDNSSLTVSQVQDIVNSALDTYDADKTGMVDYALESAGGSIINTRCTETYNPKTAAISLFGVPLWSWWPPSNPRTVIHRGVSPGECWAFRGAQGYLVIRLSGRVKISAFSMEHIPVSLAPNGRIDSAPKDFTVWGLKNETDKDPEMLGRYMYRDNATSLQSFSVQRADLPPFEIVELRIESNHGNVEYTCLYRFRVHGALSEE